MRSIILTAIFILASGVALGQDKPCDACEGVPYTKDTVMIDRFWDSVYVIVDVRDCNGVQEVKILHSFKTPVSVPECTRLPI